MPSRIAFAARFILITISLLLFSACSYPYDDDTLRREDAPPVADAGADQEVSTGVVVTLDGSGSFGAGSVALSYSWSFTSQPASSTATLSSADEVDPSFVADVDGTYVLQLVVNDGSNDSTAHTVVITASSPVADAGVDREVATGGVVTLDGSGSSGAANATLSYFWEFASLPANSTATLSSADGVAPSFVPDVDGTYVIELVLNDGSSDSASDTVTITASADAPPAADAGADQEVAAGVVVTLDGSGSSGAANAMLSYFWEFASLPASSMATLSSSDGVAPSFVADVDGTYVLQLVVNDGSSDSASDTVMIVAASAAVPVSFSADIQPIFDSNCTACHNGGISPDLTSGNAYSSLVNQPTASSSGSSDTLVVPGVSGNSELYLRVAGTSTGDQMPSGSSLSSTDQDSIRTWIDEGAENN